MLGRAALFLSRRCLSKQVSGNALSRYDAILPLATRSTSSICQQMERAQVRSVLIKRAVPFIGFISSAHDG